MTDDSDKTCVLCLTGARSLNKRMSLFIEGALDTGVGVRVLALPRGRWSLQRFESTDVQGEASTLELRFRCVPGSRVSAILCFHWAVLPLAVLIGFFRRVPVVYDEHDHYEINTIENNGPSVRRWFSQKSVQIIHRLCLPFVSLVTCIHLTNGLLMKHLQRWQANILELHNYPVAAWRSLTPDYSDSDPLCFVYMGGIFAEKGVRQAVEAFLSLPQEARGSCQLHMFGHGDADLIQELRGHKGITVHDSVTPAELRQFASRNRCCGLVLYNEHPRYRLIGTNSRKLYEYLAMGLPVISTSVGELPDFINRNEVGIVINAMIDMRELQQAMLQLAESPSRWRTLSVNARQLMAEPQMSWEHEWTKVISSGYLGSRRRAA